MMAMFSNGYVVEVMHLPDRKKPVLRLSRHGEYLGHAVFKDEDSCDEFVKFVMETGVEGETDGQQEGSVE